MTPPPDVPDSAGDQDGAVGQQEVDGLGHVLRAADAADGGGIEAAAQSLFDFVRSIKAS